MRAAIVALTTYNCHRTRRDPRRRLEDFMAVAPGRGVSAQRTAEHTAALKAFLRQHGRPTGADPD